MCRLLSAALLGCAACDVGLTPNKPNVLIYLLDDVGYGDFGYTGLPFGGVTPNVDAFARERAVHLEMFSDAVGMWHLQEPDVTTMQLQPGPLLLGNLFARSGYATAHDTASNG
ncbi:hypothetical protein T492DRAFT_872788 [Pavlovales sp. CCMP2436]|nr:hypothetical protein T492DRAFT_872788 [Pavlovales sp. CCMP2436]